MRSGCRATADPHATGRGRERDRELFKVPQMTRTSQFPSEGKSVDRVNKRAKRRRARVEERERTTRGGRGGRSMGSRLRVSNRNFAFCLQERPRFLDWPVSQKGRQRAWLAVRDATKLRRRSNVGWRGFSSFWEKNAEGGGKGREDRSGEAVRAIPRLEAFSLLLSTYRIRGLGSFRERLVISRAASRQ